MIAGCKETRFQATPEDTLATVETLGRLSWGFNGIRIQDVCRSRYYLNYDTQLYVFLERANVQNLGTHPTTFYPFHTLNKNDDLLRLIVGQRRATVMESATCGIYQLLNEDSRLLYTILHTLKAPGEVAERGACWRLTLTGSCTPPTVGALGLLICQ